MKGDALAAGGEAEEGDVVGVSPEGGDVVSDPLQRHLLVPQPVVTPAGSVLRAQEPKGTQSARSSSSSSSSRSSSLPPPPPPPLPASPPPSSFSFSSS